jgi:hypothetical protein
VSGRSTAHAARASSHQGYFEYRITPLPHLPTHLIPLFEAIAIRLERRGSRRPDALVVHSLKAVAEHGTVVLVEDRLADLDGVVGSYADQVLGERAVVEATEGEAIGDNRIAVGSASENPGEFMRHGAHESTFS